MACLVRVIAPGGVVEWLMALVLKTSEVKASAGSNPAPSVLLGSNQVLENPLTQSMTGFFNAYRPGWSHKMLGSAKKVLVYMLV